jgi:hypothetical protein
MSHLGSLKQIVAGVVIVGGLAFGGAAAVLADDEGPAPDVSHPAHIHAGDCANLDPNPVAPLNNIEPILEDSDDETANQPEGILTASRVLYSQSEEFELAWDDMLATSHSVNVHLSEQEIATYIACGEIGGNVVDDKLVIALHPLNDSGYSGIAILTKDGDGNVDVEVYLSEPVATEPAGTPVS